MKNRSESIQAWGYLVALTLIWGGAFYLIVIGNQSFSGLQVGAYRILMGMLVLLPAAFKTFKTVPSKKWPLLLFCGFLGSLFPAILFSLAEKKIASGTAGILSSLTPLFTFLIGIFFFSMKGKWLQFIGLLIGFSGAIFLSLTTQQTSQEFQKEVIYIVLATFCYGLNLNILKSKFQELSSTTVAANSLLLAGVVSFIILFQSGFFKIAFLPENGTSLLAITVLGIFATGLAIFLFNRLIKIASALFASSITYLIPVVSGAVGYFAGGEAIGLFHGISVVIILLGVYLINKKS